MHPKLLLATTNAGKIAELKALLSPLPAQLLTPQDLHLRIHVAEDGETYAENARVKALQYARAARCWALADDSGLEVEALGGAPGVRSARLAGPGRSDAERRQALLDLLAQHPRPWRARFRCVAALASPRGDLYFGEGVCEGEIIPTARGHAGFGYDPLFVVAGLGKTMAELSMEQKNTLSHRARAIAALLPILKEKLGLAEGRG
jgi:XTP/dITP diphosphohydrolase